MNKRFVLANKIKTIANEITDWSFSLVPVGNDYRVGTILSNDTGTDMNIVFEITDSTVEISTFVVECEFDEEKAKEVVETLEFPVKVAGKSGKMLMIVSTIPSKLAKSDTEIIVGSMMVSMVNAMTKIFAL